MFVQTSRYKTYTRVRLVEFIRQDGKPTTHLIEHIGSARDDIELAVLKARAEARLRELAPQLSLDLFPRHEDSVHQPRVAITSTFAYGLWHIVGASYDRVGLPANCLLKYLVVARIAWPKSKLATTRYLARNLDLSVDVKTIYRYMDTLSKDTLMGSLLDYARKQAGGSIALVFYDVTTLYFETDEEDEDTIDPITKATTAGLRKKGYSKDHRSDLPQVVVGLTVDCTGFPLDYQVYEGNTYEGTTLLDGITVMQAKLQLPPGQLTVVADAGMLSEKNLEQLEARGYRYIVGARLKSIRETQAEPFLKWEYTTQGSYDAAYKDNENRRLIVTFSDARAKRHRQNRERLVRRLEAKLSRGTVVKKSKYLILEEVDKQQTGKHILQKLTGTIDQTKVAADARYDGLRGYVTNTKFAIEEVTARYGTLWQVEKSFRMSKSDLRARPAFHYVRSRILAHLLICVCALAVMRELEQRLQPLGLMLPTALEEILAIQSYTVRMPKQPDTKIYTAFSQLQEQLLEL